MVGSFSTSQDRISQISQPDSKEVALDRPIKPLLQCVNLNSNRNSSYSEERYRKRKQHSVIDFPFNSHLE